ncbi:TVP38/TMEM64 family protein [Legionella bononiensis]|uniref:TVP38/TMEM64 family membrane protein n=1 Tax=Legionella bononiensis TaxID=2793102 RepID=A0ABS1W6I8_9GAMM|nr:TVP38/TMEM64 family protein [Legionella bononiensis]MBL7478372.1 TVP38/TMEM64 family protein [Legionella bononiensis]MBL7524969.1 TVP38/TMEM64 family protein [Legionella bononiensis]MBL7561266.1 TVP38/TMEM64 family protein [Legionella bononiensis]
MNYKKIHPVKTGCFILALASFIICAIAFQQHSLEIIEWIDDLGWLAPVLFILIYCLATLMLLPTMVLTLAGGAIFGPLFGLILNLLGATSGAALAFLITRHLTYDWFSKKRGAKLDKLITGVDEKGWIFVAFLRLVPIVPFNLVNYGMGITGIKFRLYLITTFVFLIPAEIIYTYFGYAGMDALAQPNHFYRNGGILLTGIAVLFLCIIKFIKRKQGD